MKYKLSSCVFLLISILLISGCKKDDDCGLIGRTVGQYKGDFTELSCSAPQTEEFTLEDNATADISKLSDTEIYVVLGAAGVATLLEFEAVLDTETTFTVPAFTVDGVTYTGSVHNDTKLKVFLNDGCTIFGLKPNIVKFEEGI
ncbi:MAG: hypothetical protein K9I85_09250 [Saprospiraceae bacterium]|nr:hypothetical protein [Saprospiraceae bacterium]